ncbi:MAG TPA: DNA-processing protein DprA [Steroidobacteraceae bacterium]|nr:DNA-processing protein DprA [Steroidobacteraceae bacterium]
MEADRNELRAWALLLRIPGATRQRVALALASVASVTELVRVSGRSLEQLGFPEHARSALSSADRATLDADLEWLQAPDRHLLPLTSPHYPPLLAATPDAPPALYVRGSLEVLGTPQLAIVGSRHPTSGGRDTAFRFAAHLARCGLAITSGLAEGIDAASHRGALAAGGATIAVCGTGLGLVYPQRHAELADEIAGRGALVSEFAPRTPPRREHFPRRNRIISALSLGTLVVEAARQSGSLITARYASEQGREVFAIPGSIHNPLSRGCHRLIREGAKLVETADDILTELRIPLAAAVAAPVTPDPQAHARDGDRLDKEYEILLDALGFDALGVDALVERSGLKPDAVASMLLLLELRGLVEVRPGGRYCRSPQAVQ